MAQRKKQSKLRVNQIRGDLKKSNLRIAVVIAEFNEYFTKQLLDGALDTFDSIGLTKTSVTIVHVPGSFEIPLIVKKLLSKKKYDGIMTLGVVIKGETRHFKHVVDAAATGTLQASLDCDLPVIHGVIAAENLHQAIDRCGGKMGNKGRDAARSLIQMIDVTKKIKSSK